MRDKRRTSKRKVKSGARGGTRQLKKRKARKMILYRLVDSAIDPIKVGERLTRTSDHSHQKFGEAMYFATTREDALIFARAQHAKAQHGHKYTHLLRCRIENARLDDFVDLRKEPNCIAQSKFRRQLMTKAAPAHCKQRQKKGLIWASQAGLGTAAWTEACLYPEHILDAVVIEDAEELVL